jgi:hypothetical protein
MSPTRIFFAGFLFTIFPFKVAVHLRGTGSLNRIKNGGREGHSAFLSLHFIISGASSREA